MSPEKIVSGRVILLFWNAPLFLGDMLAFVFFGFFRFSQNLCVASTWVFLKHAIFGVKKRRMQPWVSWCLELGPSFVSGSPGAAKLIFEGFKLTADPRILASNRWKLPWCYSWFNMSCRIFYDFLWWSPLEAQKIAYQDLCQLSACRFTADLWLWDWNFVSDSGIHTINCKTGLQRLPNHWPYEGLVHPNPGARCFSVSLHQLNCKRHVFLQLLNFLELPTSQSVHLGFEKWKAGCLKMTLWFLSKRFGIINFHFLSHVFNHICLELPPWFVQLVNLAKHLSDSFFFVFDRLLRQLLAWGWQSYKGDSSL